MKKGSRNGASLSEGPHDGDLEGRLLYRGPRKICYVRLWKWVSASIGLRLWGTWRGPSFFWAFERREKILI